MSDMDFERLVVVPGERFVADILSVCHGIKADNQAFLDERYGGISIEQARSRWVTASERSFVQAQYADWLIGRKAAA